MSQDSFSSPKEAQEQMLRNSNIFKQSGEQSKSVCPKHPNKRAKYYTESERSQLFCSKCALTLALMGLKIEETPSEEEVLRKAKIDCFTGQLSQLITGCDFKFQTLSETQNTLKQHYNAQRDRCTQYFDLMITRLSQLKQLYLSRLSTSFTSQLQELQSMTTTLKSSEAQLKQFLVDVERNKENIVKRMEMRPFEEIMGRYERKVEEHQKILEVLSMNPTINEIAVNTKEGLEQEINNLCERLLSDRNDFRLFETLEGDEIYQSTCSNSLQRTSSNIKLNKHSPMRLPPFPNRSQHAASRKDSGANTPDSSKCPKRPATSTTLTNEDNQKTITKVPTTTTDKICQESPRNFHSDTSNPLNSIALSLKLGLNQIREEHHKNKTPTHLKQQSCQPITQPQPSLNSSQTKNGSAKSTVVIDNAVELPLPVWQEPKNETEVGRKVQCNKRSQSKGQTSYIEASRSEGKRQFLLPQVVSLNLSKEQPAEESLKDRIFKELSGGGSTSNGESIYNQVLKINQKKPSQQQRFIKEKENFLSGDWGSQSLKKNTYLGGLIKK